MTEEPLLYNFFNEIRSEGVLVSPGLEEYYLFIQLLKTPGFTINSFDEMVFVLETIWLKSHKKKQKFKWEAQSVIVVHMVTPCRLCPRHHITT